MFWQRAVKHITNFTHNPEDVTNCTSELATCSEINLAPDTRTSFSSYKTWCGGSWSPLGQWWSRNEQKLKKDRKIPETQFFKTLSPHYSSVRSYWHGWGQSELPVLIIRGLTGVQDPKELGSPCFKGSPQPISYHWFREKQNTDGINSCQCSFLLVKLNAGPLNSMRILVWF